MENFADNERVSERSSAGFIAIGWVCAVLSLFLYPFLFGVVGVISGIIATRNNSRAGMALIISSMLLMGTGLIFSGLLLKLSAPLIEYIRHTFGF